MKTKKTDNSSAPVAATGQSRTAYVANQDAVVMIGCTVFPVAKNTEVTDARAIEALKNQGLVDEVILIEGDK